MAYTQNLGLEVCMTARSVAMLKMIFAAFATTKPSLEDSRTSTVKVCPCLLIDLCSSGT